MDKNIDGIVEIEDILALTFCCNSSVGDKCKVLFDFYGTYGENSIGFEQISKYFHCWFTMWQWEKKQIEGISLGAFDIFDTDKLAIATAENWMKYIIENKGKNYNKEAMEKEKITINEFRGWIKCNVFGDFFKIDDENW